MLTAASTCGSAALVVAMRLRRVRCLPFVVIHASHETDRICLALGENAAPTLLAAVPVVQYAHN